MFKRSVKIHNTSIRDALEFLQNKYQVDYLNSGRDFFVLGMEKFYFRNSSTQMNMIVGKEVMGSIIIDIIGVAGGSGIFNFSWGSTSEFVNSAYRELEKYSEDKGKYFEEL